MNFGDAAHVLPETFVLFVLFLTIHALINIYSSPLVATDQQHLRRLARRSASR